VGRVERQLEAKEYAIGAFLDIDGAFDSTSNIAIKQAIIRHETPEALTDWTENMLAKWNIIFHHAQKPMKVHCPQGGVLSPQLWCLVINDLFTTTTTATTTAAAVVFGIFKAFDNKFLT
jgi:hypothetical protein